MLSDCSSRVNQMSGMYRQQQIKSPYLLQLKNFEDRLNRKCPKIKKIPSMLRSQKVKEAGEDYLQLVKKMIANSQNINIFDARTDTEETIVEQEVKNKNIINRVIEKMQERKTASSCKRYRIKSKIVNQHPDILTEVASNYTQNRSRVKSQANTTVLRKNGKKNQNSQLSFLNYKKNKRLAEFGCRKVYGF